jgi:hypothetical protein
MDIISCEAAREGRLSRLTSQKHVFSAALRGSRRGRSIGLSTVYAYLREQDGANGRAGSPYYVGVASRLQRPYESHGSIPVPSNQALIRVLRSGITHHQAHEWEKYYIAIYGRINTGSGRCLLMNRTDGGEGAIGMRHSQNAKDRIAAAQRGRTMSEERRRQMSLQRKGIKLSPETCARMSEARTGGRHSAETIEKLRQSAQARAACPEWRARISARTKGKRVSQETRQRISQALTGKKQSPDTIAKRTASLTGRRHTPEAIARIRLGNAGKIAAAAQRHGVPLDVWESLPVNARSNWPRLAKERGQTLAQFIETQRTRPKTRAVLQQVPSIDLQRTHQGELPLAQVQSNFSEGTHSRAA